LNDLSEFLSRDRIHTGRRLVEQQHVWQMGQDAKERQFLAPPALRCCMPGRSSVKAHLSASSSKRQRALPIWLPREGEVLSAREGRCQIDIPLIASQPLRHVANPLLDPFAVGHDVEAFH
jgi:hypothetical protein